MKVIFPPVFRVDRQVLGNHVRQVEVPGWKSEGDLPTLTLGRQKGHLFKPAHDGEDIVLVKNKVLELPGYKAILRFKGDLTGELLDLSRGAWLSHPAISAPNMPSQHSVDTDRVLESWRDAFRFVEADQARGTIGLRTPQIGAVHAVLAHWTHSQDVATVVLPTGTGKTDTMIAILVARQIRKLLVVVPTDALRTQLSEKFVNLGVLKEDFCRALSESARYPSVCSLTRIPKSITDLDEIFGAAQIVVTTSAIAGRCSSALMKRMAEHCGYLFIDEAHHAEANTWRSFKQAFASARIVQFTATPFREDGQLLEGTIVYRYSLRRAQESGYFKPIEFDPIVEFRKSRADKVLAEKAVARLRKDLHKGHILMARAESVKRAEEIFAHYATHSDLNPVQLHTGIKSRREREIAVRKVLSGESRIIVCVDMLGEGFDLPELKIAAFHDIRKSLAITLQLVGRFTRARDDLGSAVFIANTADVVVQEELRKLYSRDPDWNALIPELNDSLVGEQLALQEFIKGFAKFDGAVPLKRVFPAISAVAFRTKCSDWAPENFKVGISGIDSREQVHFTINHAAHTIVIVTAQRLDLSWTDSQHIYDWQWELVVVHWLKSHNLLFINSSSNSGEYESLARAIGGTDVSLVRGQEVFRVFAGVNRLRLQNVGLSEQLGRNVRYTGRMGSDIEPALSQVTRRKTTKSVLSGTGFEGGAKITIGASRKGRLWTIRRDRVDQLVAWCKSIGPKLLDETINTEDVLKGTLETKTVSERPESVPIGVDWPEAIYMELEALWQLEMGGSSFDLSDVSIAIQSATSNQSLQVAVFSTDQRSVYQLILYTDGDVPQYRFEHAEGPVAHIRRGSRAAPQPLSDFFYDDPPTIWFANGSSLQGNLLAELRSVGPAFPRDRIVAWDWKGVDIRKESQGENREPGTIQNHLINKLKSEDYAVIFDDDGAGEIADVVAIRLIGSIDSPIELLIDLYHCKFSDSQSPGGRVGDLYEVCGQAQKSIAWVCNGDKKTDLFTHLLRRNSGREESGGTRIEVGDKELIDTLRGVSRICGLRFRIFVVQPGLSRGLVSADQLQLLGVTDNYLTETYQIKFGVIGSE